MAARPRVTLIWWRPHCFCSVNQIVLMLTSLHLHTKSREVCIKPGSPSASLAFMAYCAFSSFKLLQKYRLLSARVWKDNCYILYYRVNLTCDLEMEESQKQKRNKLLVFLSKWNRSISGLGVFLISYHVSQEQSSKESPSSSLTHVIKNSLTSD